jgi:hypothetical protein
MANGYFAGRRMGEDRPVKRMDLLVSASKACIHSPEAKSDLGEIQVLAARRLLSSPGKSPIPH